MDQVSGQSGLYKKGVWVKKNYMVNQITDQLL